MKKLFLSLFIMTMCVSVSYAQSYTERYDAHLKYVKMAQEFIKNSGDSVIMPIACINPEVLAKIATRNEFAELNGAYYVRAKNVAFIAEYGLDFCPYGFTKLNLDKTINYGCETVTEFKLNVANCDYIPFANSQN